MTRVRSWKFDALTRGTKQHKEWAWKFQDIEEVIRRGQGSI